MIGVDTNILVRVLVEDAPEQRQTALAFLAKRSVDDPAFVSAVVVVELVWVLQRFYEYPDENVQVALASLFDSTNIRVERRDLVLSAVAAAKERNADIADCVIAAFSAEAGAASTVTFDREASRRVPGMELLR